MEIYGREERGVGGRVWRICLVGKDGHVYQCRMIFVSCNWKGEGERGGEYNLTRGQRGDREGDVVQGWNWKMIMRSCEGWEEIHETEEGARGGVVLGLGSA